MSLRTNYSGNIEINTTNRNMGTSYPFPSPFITFESITHSYNTFNDKVEEYSFYHTYSTYHHTFHCEVLSCFHFQVPTLSYFIILIQLTTRSSIVKYCHVFISRYTLHRTLSYLFNLPPHLPL